MSLSILYSPYKTAWPARALIAWGTFGRGRLIYVTSIVHLKLLHNFLKSHLYFLLIPCSVSELFPAHTFSRIAGSNTGMSINTILPVRTFAAVQIKTQGCPPTLTVPCVSAQEQNHVNVQIQRLGSSRSISIPTGNTIQQLGGVFYYRDLPFPVMKIICSLKGPADPG